MSAMRAKAAVSLSMAKAPGSPMRTMRFRTAAEAFSAARAGLSVRRTKNVMEAAMNQKRMAVATPQPAAPMAGRPNLPNTKMMFRGTLSASPTNPATMAGRVLPWPSRKQR